MKWGKSSSEKNLYLTDGHRYFMMPFSVLKIDAYAESTMELHAGACRMSELSQSIVTSTKSAAEKKNIQMIIDTESPSDCYIQTDQLNLEKIFLNPLSNAVKYTPENGKVWYGIKEQQDEKKLSYIITVQDNGIGISKEFIDHIFEPFVQEKRPGYESLGTGRGLSIGELPRPTHTLRGRSFLLQ